MKKIDRSEKVVRIGILRGQLEGLPQATSGLRISLLPERHPRQLDREARIVWRETESGLKCAFSFMPTLQSCQGSPIIEIQIGCAGLQWSQQTSDVLPALFGRQLPDFVCRRNCSGTVLSGQSQETAEQHNENTQIPPLPGKLC